MSFAPHLGRSLDELDLRFVAKPLDQPDLETILSEYLRQVEAASESEILTSILLLDETGDHLLHAAAPNLPAAYCDAIDGIAIGPEVGSCGTAAFVGHSIYVTDIAADPLWKDFRDLALAHDLRACWSTPIFDDAGTLIGTFAVYYKTPRAPHPDDVKAINEISQRVAHAVQAHR